MGRILLFLLFVLAAVLVWKAFGPGSWKRNQPEAGNAPAVIKGPDDDEEFLWNLEKEAFKQRRARERAAEEAQRKKNQQHRPQSESLDRTSENPLEGEDNTDHDA
ncbi:MAG: hypothetical protein SOW59_08195 [Corynebacterium sp.]|nr:hypothetical protein [Corynebacterium sp.]